MKDEVGDREEKNGNEEKYLLIEAKEEISPAGKSDLCEAERPSVLGI